MKRIFQTQLCTLTRSTNTRIRIWNVWYRRNGEHAPSATHETGRTAVETFFGSGTTACYAASPRFIGLKDQCVKVMPHVRIKGDPSWTLSNDRTEGENRRQLDRSADSSYATGDKVFSARPPHSCKLCLPFFTRTRVLVCCERGVSPGQWCLGAYRENGANEKLVLNVLYKFLCLKMASTLRITQHLNRVIYN